MLAIPSGIVAQERGNAQLSSSGEIKKLLKALQEEIDGYEFEWTAARVAADLAQAEIDTIEERIERDEQLRRKFGGDEDSFIAGDREALPMLRQKAQALRVAASSIEARYKAARNRYTAYKEKALAALSPADHPELELRRVPASSGVELAAAAGSGGSDLVFGVKLADLFEAPNSFLKVTSGKASAKVDAPEATAQEWAANIARRTGAFLFDRSIDRRLSGASLSLGSEGTRFSLQIADVNAGKTLFCGDKDEAVKGCEGREFTGDRGYSRTLSFGFSSEAKSGFGKIFTGGADGGFEDNLRVSLGINRTAFRKREKNEMIEALRNAEKNIRKACLQAQAVEMPGMQSDDLLARCADTRLVEWANTKKAGETGFEYATSREALRSAVWGQAQPEWDWGLNGELGYRAFTFRDLASTALEDLDPTDPFGRLKQQPTQIEWTVDGHLGYFGYPNSKQKTERTPQLYSALLFEIGREYTYADDAKDQTVCPATSAAFNVCSKFNTAPPVVRDFRRVGTQFKILMAGASFLPEVGLAPKFTVDLNDGQFGFDLPISFIADSKDKLNAGIRLGVESGGTAPEDFSVGLFLGTTFNVGY